MKMNVTVNWPLLFCAVMILAAVLVVLNTEQPDSRANDIRKRCKPTIMYVIDNFDAVRRVYDCSEKPK